MCLHDAQLTCDIIQRRNRAEFPDDGVIRLDPLHGLNNVLGAPQVFLLDDLGLAIDAFALPRVVVGVSVDGFLDDAHHGLGHSLLFSAQIVEHNLRFYNMLQLR